MKAQERESKKERWRESDRLGERIATVGEKGHRDREDERFDEEIARMRAVIERRRHRESRYEKAPLVKEIRHGDGSDACAAGWCLAALARLLMFLGVRFRAPRSFVLF